MAQRRNYKRKRNKVSPLYLLIALFVAAALFLTQHFLDEKESNLPPSDVEDLLVHYIDVGQGDAILVQFPEGQNMLIDAGPGSSEDELLAYLESIALDKIEYFVLTHPDEDHIGGADKVLAAYEVDSVMLPDCERDTKAYKNLENAIASEGCERHLPVLEETISFGEGSTVTVLAPVMETYADVNDYSIVLRLDYYETSFLFTGDAHKEAEYDMIERLDTELLDCDVLKVGHHGSSSSTSEAFLNLVTPEIAVISCAEGNKYNHPHAEVIARLQEDSVTIYRTYQLGSILLTSNGREVLCYN